MAKGESFKEFVLDQLSELPGVSSRAMFGGHGLYLNGEFFGLVSGDSVYFKTDAESLPDYVERGSKPFQPSEKQTLTSYYEVPLDVLEDNEMMVEWAKRAAKAKAAKDGAKKKR